MTPDLTHAQRLTLELMAGYEGSAALAADYGATVDQMEELTALGLVSRRIDWNGTFYTITDAGMQAVTFRGKENMTQSQAPLWFKVEIDGDRLIITPGFQQTTIPYLRLEMHRPVWPADPFYRLNLAYDLWRHHYWLNTGREQDDKTIARRAELIVAAVDAVLAQAEGETV